MLTAIRPYLFTLKLGIENTLVYRTNFLFRALFSLLPLFAIITLWKAIYTDRLKTVSGYTVGDMVAYYLLVTVIDNLTSVTEDDWQIASDIKDGHISQFLLRPVQYLSYRLCLFSAGRCVFTVAAAGPVTLFLIAQRDYFMWPANCTTFACFSLSLVLSALLQFLLSFSLAMLAFWVFEISSFAFVLLALQRLLGGQMFPLDILPVWLQRVMLCTPLPYATFFPASIYLGRIEGWAVASGLMIQAGWVAIAFFAARFAWQRGLRSYTSVGG